MFSQAKNFKRKARGFTMTRSGWGICQLLLFVLLIQVNFVNRAVAGEAASPSEWEKIVKAAEQEGEVVYSASGSHRFLEEFHKIVPKVRAENGCHEYFPAIDTASGEINWEWTGIGRVCQRRVSSEYVAWVVYDHIIRRLKCVSRVRWLVPLWRLLVLPDM
jgi:Na+-transporting methylmalonyl-CoA/oxaloacetate decarboxylase gamma subunit